REGGHDQADDRPAGGPLLAGGEERLDVAVAVDRQQRQDDAEAEQVDENDEEDDEHRGARRGAAGQVGGWDGVVGGGGRLDGRGRGRRRGLARDRRVGHGLLVLLGGGAEGPYGDVIRPERRDDDGDRPTGTDLLLGVQ